MPNLSLCHWSRQLFDLRASSTDVPVLLLNQPNLILHAAALNKPEIPVGPLLNPTKTNLLKHQQSGVPHKDLTKTSLLAFRSGGVPAAMLGCTEYLLSPRWNGEEKSLLHVAIIAKFLDDNKPKRHLKSGFALFQISSIFCDFI